MSTHLRVPPHSLLVSIHITRAVAKNDFVCCFDRVEDGVCDCCDGSDEAPGLCTNACEELAAESRAARAEEIRLLEQGALERKDYAVKGAKAAATSKATLEKEKVGRVVIIVL